MNRVGIWRMTYGPGERATGARFRDEIAVCSKCGAMFTPGRWPYPEAGERHYQQLQRTNCDGLLLSPAAEQGWFYR